MEHAAPKEASGVPPDRASVGKGVRRALRVLAVVALMSATGSVGVASASTGEAASPKQGGSDPPQIQSNPPGACMLYELGTVKVGPDGYLYECMYVADECWYWIPL